LLELPGSAGQLLTLATTGVNVAAEPFTRVTLRRIDCVALVM
jgi:hypothetical protein